jgi:hypothetical protein
VLTLRNTEVAAAKTLLFLCTAIPYAACLLKERADQADHYNVTCS